MLGTSRVYGRGEARDGAAESRGRRARGRSRPVRRRPESRCRRRRRRPRADGGRAAGSAAGSDGSRRRPGRLRGLAQAIWAAARHAGWRVAVGTRRRLRPPLRGVGFGVGCRGALWRGCGGRFGVAPACAWRGGGVRFGVAAGVASARRSAGPVRLGSARRAGAVAGASSAGARAARFWLRRCGRVRGSAPRTSEGRSSLIERRT